MASQVMILSSHLTQGNLILHCGHEILTKKGLSLGRSRWSRASESNAQKGQF